MFPKVDDIRVRVFIALKYLNAMFICVCYMYVSTHFSWNNHTRYFSCMKIIIAFSMICAEMQSLNQ